MIQGAFEFHQDLPARPKLPERLFLGVFPDREASVCAGQCAERFIREHRLRGRQLKTNRLHVTLHHVGDYKRIQTKFVYAASQALKAVSMQPFEVTFRCIKSFEGGRPHRRPLVLLGEGDALWELHKILGTAMTNNGLRAAQDFTPHMTLLYGPERVPQQAIEPIRFVVDELVLIHSERGLTRYHVLDRRRLER